MNNKIFEKDPVFSSEFSLNNKRDKTLNKEAILYLKKIGGHRESYIDLFEKNLKIKSVVGRFTLRRFLQIIRIRKLLFGTIDDHVIIFCLLAFIRVLVAKKTSGLLLNPQSCFKSGIKSRLKRLILSSARRLPGVSILTFIPFDLLPQGRQVATHCIHDPQLWDILDNDTLKLNVTRVQKIEALADSRPILSFLGSVTAIKGINILAEIVRFDPGLCDDICILIAGKVDADVTESVDTIAKAGGIIINRRIEDSELYDIYHASSVIWCCYHPDYDIASGIFGRAMQFGKRPVIRAGAAVVSYYDNKLNADAIRVTKDLGRIVSKLRKIQRTSTTTLSHPEANELLKKWRSEFFSTVISSL